MDGFASCALLALFAWRLRSIDRRVATAGLILAVTALAPGLITIALAIATDPQDSTNANTLNHLEPRGDDLLFIGITLFAGTVPCCSHARRDGSASRRPSSC